MEHFDYGSLSAKSHLAALEIDRVWKSAACFDRTLRIEARSFVRLAEKRVRPTTFARSKLFDKMASNEPILFSNFAIRPYFNHGRLSTDGLLRELRAGFPNSTRARVRTSESVNYAPIPIVLDRWRKARSRFGVTDLHYIGTRFDRRIDTSGLNDFNLLPRGTDGYESQDSLVISTAGGFTDSHSDDHSGSNHSFVGTKLWLLWDTLEGFEHGLEDVERCAVYNRAAFDMDAFLAMKSSCWIFIGPGQTMFIPANLTHKVVTLEQYLGLGSFHAGLPGLPNLLSHWAKLSPSWAAPFQPGRRGSVEFLVRRAVRRVRELKTQSRTEQYRWGLPYMRKVLRRMLIDRVQDPRWTEVGHANFNNFVIAASQI
ncbi:hypothetical protein NLM27_39935 [Bradyrhizobium sp. CCGB12]|uniref:hypothetical protein n=1 Tax=Bradyrhizobium sp. CCGB12 TaxID=2949632 RepID=UPI0020B222F4|nr:hypothetical protein [Bradyrhizobium sp. CCGB12]MCP3394925.1 hypothetical protein [Bradyrhizobium sp. CCGB12]